MEHYVKDGWKFNHRPGTTDRQTVDEVYSYPLYDLSHYSGVKTVLDIGAHIGSFSVRAMHAFPKATVYAFEPVRENFGMLNANTGDSPRLVPFPCAVTGQLRPDRVVRIMPDRNTGASMYGYGSGKAVVPYMRITDILDWAGDGLLVKMDCESAEYDILKHLKLSRLAGLIIEFHPFGNKAKLERTLELIAELKTYEGFEVVFEVEDADLPKIAFKKVDVAPPAREEPVAPVIEQPPTPTTEEEEEEEKEAAPAVPTPPEPAPVDDNECPECGRVFKTKAGLKSHSRTHTA
jgi:FkbM family methyltransferase